MPAAPQPLTRQLVEYNLVGGLDQKTDGEVTARPTELLNCVYRKSGSVAKRHGFTCISSSNARLDGTTMPIPEMLTTANNGQELLRVGGTDLDVYEPVGSSDWIKRGLLSEASISSTPIGSAVRLSEPGGNSTGADPSVAIEGNYQVTVYTTVSGSQYKVLADVIDLSSGVAVVARFVLASSTTLLASPQVAGNGSGTVCVAHTDAGTSKIGLSFLNTSTLVWTTGGSIASGANVGIPIALTSFSNQWVVAYQDNSTQLVKLQQFYNGGTASSVTIPSSLPGPDGPSLFSITLRGFAGEKIWVQWSYRYSDVGSLTFYYGCNLAAISASTFAYIGTTQLDVTPDTTYNFPYLGIERISATSVLPIWTAISTANSTIGKTSWNETTLTGTTWSQAYSPNRSLRWFALLSRPFSYTIAGVTRVYALMQNIHAVQCSQFLVDLSQGQAIPTGTTPRMVAVAFPGQIPGILTPADFPRATSVSDVATLPSGKGFVVGSMTQSSAIGATATTQNRAQSIYALTVQFGPVRQAEDTVGGLVIGGGYLAGYDGISTYEIGFSHFPDATKATAFTQNTSGAMTPSKTYYYVFVFSWRDAKGRIHRSSPSSAISITLTGGNAAVGGYAPTLHLTNKVGPTNDSPVLVEIYRTIGSPGTAQYYLLGAVQNDPTVDSIAFADTISDAVIATRQALYAQPGGATLDNVIPSGSLQAHVHQNAVFSVGTDDGSIWVSKALVAGEGLSFNDSLTISPFVGGPVTGLATLDSILVIFKQDSIYYITGTPPNDNGVSSLSDPLKIQTDIGCTDFRSIGVVPGGLLFWSAKANSMCMLSSGSLQVSQVGKAVEDSYAANAQFCASVTLPFQSALRVVQRGTSVFASLNYDYYHGGVWSRDSWQDVANGGGLPNVLGATLWKGTLVWITYSGGLYQENTGFFDIDRTGNTTWVQMTFQTSVDHVLGLQSYKRVWNASVSAYYGSAHGATVTLISDLDIQPRTWTDTETSGMLDAMSDLQFRIKPREQKLQKLIINFQDAPPALLANYGTGQGPTLRAITLELGVKTGIGKTKNATSK